MKKSDGNRRLQSNSNISDATMEDGKGKGDGRRLSFTDSEREAIEAAVDA